jgi:hypothetical protein
MTQNLVVTGRHHSSERLFKTGPWCSQGLVYAKPAKSCRAIYPCLGDLTWCTNVQVMSSMQPTLSNCLDSWRSHGYIIAVLFAPESGFLFQLVFWTVVSHQNIWGNPSRYTHALTCSVKVFHLSVVLNIVYSNAIKIVLGHRICI